MQADRTPSIFVVSDGRGDTCRDMVDAALVQFPGQDYDIEMWPGVTTVEKVDTMMATAAARNATVFYTLVSDMTRHEVHLQAKQYLIPVVDLLGPAFSALHDTFKSEPLAKPGLFYDSDRERFDRHKAIDYTLKHDDGQRVEELEGADVVVVGLSRASKSTTCFTLAYQGIKAANVPLLMEVEPPRELIDLDPSKVIGLRVNTSRLMTVRMARAPHLGVGYAGQYVDRPAIAREINFCNALIDRYGWRSFDASYMAIEEIAREVMRLMRESGS